MMNNKPVRLFAFIFSVVFLVACGQKGPLILPGPEATPVVEAAAPAVEDDEQESEANDAQDNAQDSE